jgi:lipopolysaccharide cholinephosphotransferase
MVELEIAKEVDRICRENDIKYFMDSGTLLGAIRHKGFIPWDDDIDFGMLRAEYEKFIKIAPKALSDKYFLQTWETDSEYPFAFAKVRKKGTLFQETAAKNSKYHNEIFIDIFPYDTFPVESEKQRYQGKKVMKYRLTLMMKAKMTPWLRNKSLIKRLGVYIKYLPYRAIALMSDRKRLIEKYTSIMQLYNAGKTGYVYEQSGGAPYGKWVVSDLCIGDYSFQKFEDTEFMAPQDCHLYLKTCYGDYMKLPPKEKQVNHQVVNVYFGEEEK